MFKEGCKSIDGSELELGGEEEGFQYSIVGEWDGLEENDYIGELFINQHKWSELVGREELSWQQ